MTSRRSRARAGITLTEILIAIMIMGIGMVSLATLFPLGLLRMRDATRASRSTILAQSAMADANVRSTEYAGGLLNPDAFLDPRLVWYQPWIQLNGRAQRAGFPFTITPLTHDFDTINNDVLAGVAASFFTPGLPVAYDPLFWSTTHYLTEGQTPVQTPTGLRGNLGSEGRFGSGIGFVRSTGNNPPSAHGLQRITNFQPYDPSYPWPYTYSLPSTNPALLNIAEVAGKIFSSIDDPVITGDESGQSGSPVVPADFDPTAGYSSEREWDFTWMITGRLGVAGDPSTFEGNIVVFHKRPIGLDPVVSPLDGNTYLVPTGERVVEAIWGYTSSAAGLDLIPAPQAPGITGGYSAADDRSVLLRWPASMPDPLVRVGDFIADVTYERYQETTPAVVSSYPSDPSGRPIPLTRNYLPDNPLTGWNGARYPGQRVHWYRIVQKGEVEIDPDVAGHRRIIVRIDTPVQAKTRLVPDGSGGVSSAVPEAALINPYVVNVFPVVLYSR
ncbi:type IV pilus modification PilV family protein [Tautonia sociabilis]|uniref:Uncharacterized protein n=1 Tax=Tautonia sociabilis TaxID=2080755 RepID=A0A432MDE2_9BACT|nr:hypothetical protein [Tautonia sociabilis]RUL82038.1 hypothetical protein TsocGM_24050 [Tautonia sociabilis]